MQWPGHCPTASSSVLSVQTWAAHSSLCIKQKKHWGQEADWYLVWWSHSATASWKTQASWASLSGWPWHSRGKIWLSPCPGHSLPHEPQMLTSCVVSFVFHCSCPCLVGQGVLLQDGRKCCWQALAALWGKAGCSWARSWKQAVLPGSSSSLATAFMVV